MLDINEDYDDEFFNSLRNLSNKTYKVMKKIMKTFFARRNDVDAKIIFQSRE